MKVKDFIDLYSDEYKEILISDVHFTYSYSFDEDIKKSKFAERRVRWFDFRQEGKHKYLKIGVEK